MQVAVIAGVEELGAEVMGVKLATLQYWLTDVSAVVKPLEVAT